MSTLAISFTRPLIEKKEKGIPEYLVLVFFALHISLAYFMNGYKMLSTIHALSTLGIGLLFALRGRSKAVAYTAAYLVGSEVLWRMTGAQVFWEYGKYAVILLFLVVLLRQRRFRIPLLPLLFFLLLLPSAWFTADSLGMAYARDQWSFYLSGPLCLFVAAWFFKQQAFTPVDLRKLFVAFIAPVVGITFIATFSTVTNEALVFGNRANYITSGGYGPNQVSSALGLGALLLFFYLIFSRRKSNNFFKGILITLLLIMVFQCALTFSRGGLAMAFGALVVAAMILMRSRRNRVTVLVVSAILFLSVEYIMIPFFDDLTGGMLTERYTNTSTTGRAEIAMMELELFRDNPMFGVGPGRGTVYQNVYFGVDVASHTEFTRLLSEHGLFGLLSLLLLLGMSLKNVRRVTSVREKAFVASVIVWSLLFFFIYAFRLAMPGFFIGITFAMLLAEEQVSNRFPVTKGIGKAS